MTKFQTAQERGTRIPHGFDPSAIVQLHDDPEPSIEDTLLSSSLNPEELLLLKEEFFQELDDTDNFNQFFEIAPTTSNLSESDRNVLENQAYNYKTQWSL